MNTDVMKTNQIEKIFDEYQYKTENIETLLKEYKEISDKVKTNSLISGTYTYSRFSILDISPKEIRERLNKSAWKRVYEICHIDTIAPANERNKFQQDLESPPEFTYENVIATFGDYVKNPFDHILRGLAEVFCSLDDSYKSHSKVKIGVEKLPKRVIISNTSQSYSNGYERIFDIMKSLFAYQGNPPPNRMDISELHKDGECLKDSHGIWLKRFKNGNAHLHFSRETLQDINRALSEYYGNVLPDDVNEFKESKKTNTEISKDLQYYPTPKDVIERMVYSNPFNNTKVLEPSCGTGNIMEYLRNQGAEVFGIECDFGRVNVCRNKGFDVLHANFLEVFPNPVYDYVVGNPPFYGKHYYKHLVHAMKFLKTPRSRLIFVLPATAKYDHNLLEDFSDRRFWIDLPVGSFRNSGTNINTVIFSCFKEEWNNTIK